MAGARFQSASANLSLITALVTTELSFSLSRHAGRNTTFDGYVSASKLCNLLFSSLVDWPDVASGTDSLIPPRFRMSSQSGASSSFREIPIPTRKIPVCRAVSTTFARHPARYCHRRPLNPQSSVYLVCFARLPILIFRFSRLRQLDFYWDTCSRYPHSSIAMAAVRAVVATNALSRQINSRCSVSKSIKLPGLVQSRKFRGSSTIVMVQRVEKSDTEWAKEVRNRNQDPTRAHRPSRSEPRR